MRRRRSQVGLVLAGAVIVAGGLAVGLVELLRLPKGTIWVVVAATVGLVVAIMRLSGR